MRLTGLLRGIAVLLVLWTCASGSATANQSDPTEPLEWLLGHWTGDAPGVSHTIDLTLTASGDGAHGMLVAIDDAGRRRTLAEYTISRARSTPRLLLVEGGRRYRFISASVDGRHLRFDRRSYKPGTIVVEFSTLQETLFLRHAYGPQHGATPSMEYRLKRSATTAD